MPYIQLTHYTPEELKTLTCPSLDQHISLMQVKTEAIAKRLKEMQRRFKAKGQQNVMEFKSLTDTRLVLAKEIEEAELEKEGRVEGGLWDVVDGEADEKADEKAEG